MPPSTPAAALRAGLGATIGLLLVGFVGRLALGTAPEVPFLVAPLGAAAVLLFALPGSPVAQAWPVIGGNCLSALVGVTCGKLVADPLLAAPLACGLAIAVMSLGRCLHPPGGAVALVAVIGGPAIHAAGYGFVLWPVGASAILLLATARLFHLLESGDAALLRGRRRADRRSAGSPAPARHQSASMGNAGSVAHSLIELS